jgi:hypothetical protein
MEITDQSRRPEVINAMRINPFGTELITGTSGGASTTWKFGRQLSFFVQHAKQPSTVCRKTRGAGTIVVRSFRRPTAGLLRLRSDEHSYKNAHFGILYATSRPSISRNSWDDLTDVMEFLWPEVHCTSASMEFSRCPTPKISLRSLDA